MYEIGQLIKYHREKMNLSQKQLGKMAGYSAATISKLESGQYHPPEHLLKAIQSILHINELVHDETHPTYVQLSSWQKVIASNNIAESQHCYQQIKKLPNSYYINYESIYLLHSFQHFLLCFNLKEARSLFDVIQEKAYHFTPQKAYQYNKTIARFYMLQDELKNCLAHLHVSKKLNQETYQKDGDIYLYHAIVYSKAVKISDSNHNATKAIELFQESMDVENILLSRVILIINDMHLGYYHRSIESLHHILENNPKSMNKTFIQYILALAYFFIKDYEISLKYSRNAIYSEKRPALKMAYLYLRATTFAVIGDPKNAIVYINGGLQLNQSKKYTYKLYILQQILEQTCWSLEFQHKMKKEIIPYFTRAGDQVEVDFCYALLGDIYHSLQHYKQSSNYYYQSGGNPLIAEILAKYPQK
ncbi:helix-turn-helix domain-containing protein [Gracilibacillus kekensis]|uniref:Helix-turn-helix n=1 Tax=Gracilibacillus kekensis TaxID=1027249 RepID=A0A1M7K5A7_9BACI|nr:helix-turn-helix transcriptional regulator [Gracilibacillus kekensis]SHM60371.1 Helix-turn-helix [Gracilibacillus kekensis]